MIAAKCPCGAKLKAADDALGKKGKCPHCGTTFPIIPWLFCARCRADISVDPDGDFTCKCQDKGSRRSAFGGPPGSSWSNTTRRTRYQFCAQFHEDCSICFRTSGHIGPAWGIPFVTGCNCKQRAIQPGESFLPFTDVDAELARTTPEQRDLIFGRSNRLLLDGGLVSWTDLIGRYAVIELNYVIFNKSLSLQSILAAGVPAGDAHAAWDRVSLRRAEDDKRREILAKLKAAGITLTLKRG